MGKPYGFTKEQVLEAIKGCSTIVSKVAQRLKCDWNTAKKYINKWKETKEAFENERQTTLDFAESKLLENISNGHEGSIKWFLSKKGKDRGYGEDPNEMLENFFKEE